MGKSTWITPGHLPGKKVLLALLTLAFMGLTLLPLLQVVVERSEEHTSELQSL